MPLPLEILLAVLIGGVGGVTIARVAWWLWFELVERPRWQREELERQQLWDEAHRTFEHMFAQMFPPPEADHES